MEPRKYASGKVDCFCRERPVSRLASEKDNRLRVHLINPSDTAFGTAVITPRWLFVLAAATPEEFGDPVLCDETLEPLTPPPSQPAILSA